MKTTMKKNDATNAYVAARAKALELIAALQQAVEDQPAPDSGPTIHWGHVGSLGHLNEVLDEALAFITNRE